MASAILLLSKDDPSSNPLQIIDSAGNINTLWTTASTKVDGYFNFTSVDKGYARWAQVYTNIELTADGKFLRGTVDGSRTFDAGYLPPGYVGDSVPIDGLIGDLGATQLLVNQLRLALLNSSIVRPLAD